MAAPTALAIVGLDQEPPARLVSHLSETDTCETNLAQFVGSEAEQLHSGSDSNCFPTEVSLCSERLRLEYVRQHMSIINPNM